MSNKAKERSNSRRSFLRASVVLAAVDRVASGTSTDTAHDAASDPGQNPGSLTPQQRRRRAYNIRRAAAAAQRDQQYPLHLTNGDEQRYANRIGSFSKALPHNDLGEVDVTAWDAMDAACQSGNWQALESVPMGGVLKLANPLSSLAYSSEGGDSHQFDLQPPPALASAEAAGELVEVYWRALTRDVAFADYESSPLIAEAADDLSRLTDFKGAKAGARVTPATLFRGDLPGERSGPFLSQFLLVDIPYGSSILQQKWRSFPAGADYGVAYIDALGLQRGARAGAVQRESTPRYIRNMRDLTAFVHLDYTFEAYLHAALILGGMGAPVTSKLNPYGSSRTMGAFATFGAPMVLDLISRSAVAALKAAWCQKWLVHKRVRPEAMAIRVHNHLTGQTKYPLHLDVLYSKAVARLKERNGTYLLPLAYPEGSPAHPSFPGGHASVAGAAVTILKALHNEDAEFPNPVVADSEGRNLNAWGGERLTIAGELNKLASNISYGRDSAGMHYRSDEVGGLTLGEAVAIELLRECKPTFAEHFQNFRVTRFDGTTERI